MREIPGFYYDEDKQKYFKIQHNHLAPSTSSASSYSFDGVKRRKFEEQVKETVQRRANKRRNLVCRAKLGALDIGILDRELGRAGRATCARGVVQQWQNEKLMWSEAYHRDYRSTGGRRARLRGLPIHSEPQDEVFECTLNIGTFDYDVVTKTLFFPQNQAILCAIRESDNIEDRDYIRFHRDRLRNLMIGASDISSIHVNPSSRSVITTWRAPQRGANVCVLPMDEAESYSLSCFWTLRAPQGYDLDLLTSVPAPPGSAYGCAIGTSDGYITSDANINSFKIRSCSEDAINTIDMFALEFLPALSPAVLLTGQRSGLITIRDDRSSTAAEAHISHPSAVTHIKQVDRHHIVVAGLGSTLCQYDLRYCPRKPSSQIWPATAQHRRQNRLPRRCTATVLQYREHENDSHPDLGLDVDTELGLIAAAQNNHVMGAQSNTVRLFSLHDSHVVRTIAQNCGYDKGGALGLPIKAMKFVEERIEGIKSLWYAQGTQLLKCGC